MSRLPASLYAALTEALGTEPLRVTPCGGGMVNEAARVETAQGTVFVKWKANTPAGFFALEADGLDRLRAAGALRVPEVIAFQDHPRPAASTASEPKPESGTPSFLVLEYIETRPPNDSARFAARFGEGLARLHHDNLSPFGAFGLETANFLGSQPQINTPTAGWTEFYREYRLLPQIAIARRQRLLPERRERLLMQVVERLETLLAGLPARPTLLHGDLWSGNFLPAGEEAVLIDPAVYYGEREMEIAFMELFGGFPDGLLDAYHAAYPLDAGYPRRRFLHQIYPLLIHLNHFGESYGPRVEHACRSYVG